MEVGVVKRRSPTQKKLFYTSSTFAKRSAGELNELVEERVVWILLKYEKTRENDTLLVLRYWQMFSPYTTINLTGGDNYDLANPYDIIRSRKQIQNKLRLFRPTDPVVVKAREIKQDVLKTDYVRF